MWRKSGTWQCIDVSTSINACNLDDNAFKNYMSSSYNPAKCFSNDLGGICVKRDNAKITSECKSFLYFNDFRAKSIRLHCHGMIVNRKCGVLPNIWQCISRTDPTQGQTFDATKDKLLIANANVLKSPDFFFLFKKSNRTPPASCVNQSNDWLPAWKYIYIIADNLSKVGGP